MFDPRQMRDVYYEYQLGAMERIKLEWFDPQKPVGNYGIHLLNNIISGYLVNLKNEVDIYLPTVHEWLDFAINRNEIFGEGASVDFHHARLYMHKALALWLSNSINAEENWENSFKIWSKFDDPSINIYPKRSIKTDFLDDFLMLCVQCKQYQAGIVRFEQYHGKKGISIKRKLTPREYGYLLCLNHFDPKYTALELAECGGKMLSRYMEEPWLRMGLYSYAATWLKIVYWDHQVTTNAFDTIQKAYECMPNTEPL
ncbi:MAG: hypothetical protein GAK29_03169 [Acinetobacter bereziniae]|uniref:Uncharacterized protein n=1 Tax=Acinetobacter bereziniae TaxID=106648 RepID=A0A833PC93_ACIBZ|nr:MAG: hypothetical protein GAK29_03169 [Acinetobacter bereziniae]